jgi:hypothetical protein
MSADWETFCDSSYFDLWRVRRKNERGFNDGYHLQNGEEAKALVELLNRVERERDEARQRASDLALGVKVADCMYDYGKYSVALREAKIKARYLQELTRAAYDEVEKLEDQEAAK